MPRAATTTSVPPRVRSESEGSNAQGRTFVRARRSLHLLLDAPHLVLERLNPVGARPDAERGAHARNAHVMQYFVAPPHCGEHLVPVALDVGAVGVQRRLEAGLLEYPLACRDVLRQGQANPEGDDGEIDEYLHAGSPGPSYLSLLYTSDAADEEDSVDLGGR